MKRLILISSLLALTANVAAGAGLKRHPKAVAADATHVQYHGNSSYSSVGRLYFPRTDAQPVKHPKSRFRKLL